MDVLFPQTIDIPSPITSLLSLFPQTILSLLFALTLPLLTLLYIHYDYCAFLSLGPGGTPSTPLGYLKIKLLSLVSLRDPYRPLPVPSYFRPQSGYLTSSSLCTRPGRRPLVRGIAPQRQQSQKSPASVYKLLVASLQSLSRDPTNALTERTSCFEKHSSGLFAKVPITRTCGGEICHAHPSDGSMHLTLHPADAKIVLEAGWGERHPLAKGGWFRRFVPREFVLVYAPREEREVETVVKVVEAAVWWVSGVDVRREDGESVKERGVGDEDALRASRRNECWACKMHGCGNKNVEKMVGSA
ncbi:hypothetical protein BCR34DRAFT_384168 [Clohesyomyces aquaticus]|uniref:Luciferase domain-containing protein n=1 Tax=Clohesyomyces aquaticus TaxID=1231657 RepID=A0A1Y1ZGJ2_9PLEO|nr:hypothetical protein BCR34DRAFT_384168 [Clohesyomyces aquaticus]